MRYSSKIEAKCRKKHNIFQKIEINFRTGYPNIEKVEKT